MTVTSNTANGYSGTLTHQFEVAQNISGTGTKDEPYLINTTDDWNLFAKSVEGGIDYYGKYVKLTNNITISTMVGVCDESGDRPLEVSSKAIITRLPPISQAQPPMIIKTIKVWLRSIL